MKLQITILVFGLIIISIGDVYGADWTIYHFDEECLDSYDVQSMTRTSENTFRFWTRRDLTEKGIIDAVANLGKKYKNLFRIQILMEINCKEKNFRTLSDNWYDDQGKTISSSNRTSEWTFIPPESVMEDLYEEICK